MPQRRRRSHIARANLFAIGAAALASLAACTVIVQARGRSGRANAAGPVHHQTAPITPSPTPPPQMAKIKPDELGRVPILMYHSVGDAPSRAGLEARIQRMGLNISPALFRKHLQMFYEAGFYPVNMRDLLSPRLDVPAGKTPVVLTFDDARGSQFHYRKDGTIDPNCAVGIMEAFHRAHPDAWPERASFYVLPASKYNPVPFYQAGLQKKKVQYLVSHGYEIANHSTSHRPMARMDARTLQWEMATCAQYFRALDPNVTMDTMALPYGIAPAKSLMGALIEDGRGTYHNRCILLAAGDASYAPADRRFDTLRVMRIGSEPGNIEHWVKVLKNARASAGAKNASLRPYVSDGDPGTLAVPASQEKRLDKSRLGGDVRLMVYNDMPKKASPPAKIPVAAKSPASKKI